MKPFLNRKAGLAVAALGVTGILTFPAEALAGQADRGGGGGSSGGASAGGSSGATSGGGADRGGSGGGGGGSIGGSSAGSSGGARAGATGGTGIAMPRPGSDRSSGGGSPRFGGGAVARTTGRTQDDPGERSGVPRYSRPHDPNVPVDGTAVPRPPNSTPTRGGGGTTYIIPGTYYGGYGLGYPYGGYYGGYYDPWYDPWYGGYPGYSGGYQTSTSTDEGSLRLKIKPKTAEVYVDGYFEGIVDDFDGIFQRLHLDSGVHRIEVRAPGYESLTFEVRITADHTTTYQGAMQRIP